MNHHSLHANVKDTQKRQRPVCLAPTSPSVTLAHAIHAIHIIHTIHAIHIIHTIHTICPHDMWYAVGEERVT